MLFAQRIPIIQPFGVVTHVGTEVLVVHLKALLPVRSPVNSLAHQAGCELHHFFGLLSSSSVVNKNGHHMKSHTALIKRVP